VVATDTGGVGSVIKDGVTGCLLPITAGPDAYADKFQALVADPATYFAMAVASRQRFEQVLNWDAWSSRVAGITNAVLEQRWLPSMRLSA
jgi:glycosyltransferase involved in cell wall biosynthesis